MIFSVENHLPSLVILLTFCGSHPIFHVCHTNFHHLCSCLYCELLYTADLSVHVFVLEDDRYSELCEMIEYKYIVNFYAMIEYQTLI